jgi:HlyD family secretion protein
MKITSSPWQSLLFISGVFILGGFAGCGQGKSDPNPKDLYTVKMESLEIAVDELGIVESTKVSKISTPFRGTIVTILSDGTMVEEGEVVAVLDTTDLEDDLESEIENLKNVKKDLESTIENMMIDLRSNALDVNSAMAELDLTRVQLADVNQNLSELEYLRERDIVAEDQVYQASSSVRNTEISTYREDMNLRGMVTGAQNTEKTNEIRMERIGLRGDKSMARISEKQEQIKQANVIAPVAGLFSRQKNWSWQLRRRVERQPGEQVSEGEHLGSIPDLRALVVRSQVPESEMMRVSPGSDVTVLFEALEGLELEGKILTMAPIAIERETSAGGQMTASGEELTGEKVFEIVVELEELDKRLRPGLTARAKIMLERRDSTLTVPIESIYTDGGKHYLSVWTADKKKDLVEVQLGMSGPNKVEVLSGVKQGDQIFLTLQP